MNIKELKKQTIGTKIGFVTIDGQNIVSQVGEIIYKSDSFLTIKKPKYTESFNYNDISRVDIVINDIKSAEYADLDSALTAYKTKIYNSMLTNIKEEIFKLHNNKNLFVLPYTEIKEMSLCTNS